MTYQAEISRENPTCLLFVIDQSGSMDEVTEAGRSIDEDLAVACAAQAKALNDLGIGHNGDR